MVPDSSLPAHPKCGSSFPGLEPFLLPYEASPARRTPISRWRLRGGLVKGMTRGRRYGGGLRLVHAADIAQIALAAMLTISANSAVLKKKEMMPCTVAVRRMVLSVMPTSETCAVMPITNEKYTKSQ